MFRHQVMGPNGTSDTKLIERNFSDVGAPLRFDLVLFDEHRASSTSRLVEELKASSRAEFVDKPGGIFVLYTDTTSDDDIATISAAACVVLLGNGGSLADQLDQQRSMALLAPQLAASKSRKVTASSNPVEAEGSARPVLPPAPWCNVMANESFGCLTTEAGLG
jgi:cellobiose phosphorylase